MIRTTPIFVFHWASSPVYPNPVPMPSSSQEHKGKVKRNYTVHKVPDGEEVKEITRWSDLQKYIYIPQVWSCLPIL